MDARLSLLLLTLLSFGCTGNPSQLRRFEHVENGSRISYTVDMFERGERRLNGYWVSFRPDSDQKWTEGSHTDGKMHGVWTWWDAEGDLTAQKVYDRGKILETKSAPPWWGYSENQK